MTGFNFQLTEIHGFALVLCASRQAKLSLLEQAKAAGIECRDAEAMTRQEIIGMQKTGTKDKRPVFGCTAETPKADRKLTAWISIAGLRIIPLASWVGVYDGATTTVYKERLASESPKFPKLGDLI